VNQSEIDWTYLRQDTLVPAATALTAVVVLVLSIWFVSAQNDSYARISVDQDVMNADYNALVTRKRLVDRYHRRYELFQQQGFIAEENRLDWVETLRESAGRLRLPSLTYSMEPQLKVVPPIPPTSADAEIEIFLSKLELEVGLVHEDDLLRLFGSLQATAPGLLKVDQCQLNRQAEHDELQAIDANIVASCSVDLFSILTSDVASEEPAL
jgi:hypothetical protein